MKEQKQKTYEEAIMELALRQERNIEDLQKEIEYLKACLAEILGEDSNTSN